MLGAGAGAATINTLLSYMWIKSDVWGTVNWGQLSQATDNVALLPDLSGTIIEANAVLFDGAGMFVRPKGAKNSNDLSTDFAWGAVVNCLSGGGGVGADCAGYPYNGFRYDTPTWAGFSVSTGYYEDDVWDVAVKYAADWNSIKFSAAVGYTQLTDEGCNVANSAAAAKNNGVGNCTNAVVQGGGGAPFQNFRKDAQIFQVGASILHVPSGLFVYGLYQREENDGTQWKTPVFNGNPFLVNNFKARSADSAANENDVWYIKAGIKRAWWAAGSTVLFGEWGRYEDQFMGFAARRVHRHQAAASSTPTGTSSATTLFAARLCRSASLIKTVQVWPRVKFFFVMLRSPARQSIAGASAWCRRSTLPRCMCSPAGSILIST